VTAPALALRAHGLLRDFNVAGVLTAADVHVAQRVGALGGEHDEAVLLALALTVRSTRHGSVVLDLATAEASTSVDADRDEPVDTAALSLAWPQDWVARCAASPLVGGPLRLQGSQLWLARYWDQEALVASELLTRSATPAGDLDLDGLRSGLDRLFRPADADQRGAAAVCALARVSVLAGGPGTGKTTTVARLLALLREQHPAWRIALAAPTGKAAARLEEAVRSSTAGLPLADGDRLGELSATTLHRLLGWRPEARTRFRHDRGNRLPYEVVVVDESSMVSLTMMARLLEALRPTTRLVLVGDPDQLASVEAGAVLGDLVASVVPGARTPGRAAALASLGGPPAAEVEDNDGARLRDGVATLLVNRRFTPESGIARLSRAVQAGDGSAALAVLQDPGVTDVELVPLDDDAVPGEAQLAAVRADVQSAGRAMHEAAAAGDAARSLAAMEGHRLLCAHRRGLRGAAYWSTLVARWLAEAQPVVPREDGHYVGEPLLVTTNDYEVGLYNGDTGVVYDDADRGLTAAFSRGGAPVLVPLVRLGAVSRLHAMTVHRSQGSQFQLVTVVLPPAGSPLGTRETLYTASTRAMGRVRLIGGPDSVVAACERPAARATGLATRLG
jgi:exodeoxyribonuclease V alpha subunit